MVDSRRQHLLSSQEKRNDFMTAPDLSSVAIPAFPTLPSKQQSDEEWGCAGKGWLVLANPVYSGRSTVGEMGGNSKGMIVLSLEVWVIVIASSYLSKLITYTRLCMFCSFRFWVL